MLLLFLQAPISSNWFNVIHILLQSPINPNKVQVWATPVKFFYPLTLSYPSCQIAIKTWETCQHHIFYLTFLIFHYRLLPHTGLVLPFMGWTRGSMLYASLPELWWANSYELSPIGNLLWKLSLCVSLCVLPMLWYMKGQGKGIGLLLNDESYRALAL